MEINNPKLRIIPISTYKTAGGNNMYGVKGIIGLDPRTLGGSRVLFNSKIVTINLIETYAVHDPIGKDFAVSFEEE